MCHHPYHILCIRIIMRDMVEETAIGPLREGLAETLHSSLASRRIRALPTMPPCPHTQCVSRNVECCAVYRRLLWQE
jgi:hypothetical protein